MESERVVPGRWIGEEEPDWTGLEALLPIGLCGPFMWMGSVMLEDGTLLGAYKHAATRRYFHLDASGATFGYRGEAGYCRVRHCNAVEHVFDPLWLLHHATDEDRSAVITALDEASKRDHADWEAGLSLQPSRV